MKTNSVLPLEVVRQLNVVVEYPDYLGVTDVYKVERLDNGVRVYLKNIEDLDRYFVQELRLMYDTDTHEFTLFQRGMCGHNSKWTFGEKLTKLDKITLRAAMQDLKRTPREIEEGFYELDKRNEAYAEIMIYGLV